MPRSYGFLGAFPPSRCGLASFTCALVRSLITKESGDVAGVVRVIDMPVRSCPPEVVGHLQIHSPTSHRGAAQALNGFEVAIVQYDRGMYGGQDDDQLLAVLEEVRVPVVLVAHTVPGNPTLHQAFVLGRAMTAVEAVVTMSHAARARLICGHDVDPAKVTVIGHGASPMTASVVPDSARRPLILTWGTLEPGMGIESAIGGLRHLRHLNPVPAYIVAGRMHPRVHWQEGAGYISRLQCRARMEEVGHLVRFVGSHVDDATLARLIRRADIVLLPYDSGDDVGSHVLVEAIAAGKPVVATAFPHALELLSGGAGLLVPHCNADAIAEALYRVLTQPALARSMAAHAAALAPARLWPAVAESYRKLADALLAEPDPAVPAARSQMRSPP